MRRIFSLITAVALVWFIYTYFTSTPPVERAVEPVGITKVFESVTNVFSDSADENVSTTENKTTEQPLSSNDVKLSSLNLKPEHIALLKKVGIDVETFVVTKEMMVCAEKKVGKDRIGEFIAGNTPTLAEMSTLIGCLK